MKTEILTAEKQEMLIDQIHADFYEAHKLIMEVYKRKRQEVAQKVEAVNLPEDHIDKSQRLAAYGFNRINYVKTVNEKLGSLNKYKSELTNADLLINEVEYFLLHYPQNKFITGDIVREICKTYDLVFGPSEYYIKDIPEKNIQEICDFVIKPEDRQVQIFMESNTFDKTKKVSIHKLQWENMKYDIVFTDDEKAWLNSGKDVFLANAGERFRLKPFMIVAPADHFEKGLDMQDYELKKITTFTVPDPIVLCPVKNNNYLVITAWGKEALYVQNENKN